MDQAHFTIAGNLTQDPKLFPSYDGGRSRCCISVAVNGRRGEERTVDYFDVSVFGELGENVASCLHKGQGVVVVGRPRTYPEPYTTPDGKETHRTRIGLTATTVAADMSHQSVRATKLARSSKTAHRHWVFWPLRLARRPFLKSS